MRQGDVYWFVFAAPDKRRPVVILTRSAIIPARTQVTVAPLTTNVRGNRSEVRVGPADGLPQESVVSLDNITTVRVSELRHHIGTLGIRKMREIRAAIEFAFAFEELK